MQQMGSHFEFDPSFSASLTHFSLEYGIITNSSQPVDVFLRSVCSLFYLSFHSKRQRKNRLKLKPWKPFILFSHNGEIAEKVSKVHCLNQVLVSKLNFCDSEKTS